MSGFFRPEVAGMLRQWREGLVALGVIAIGLWITFNPGPIVQGFGYVLIALGALGLVPAIRRARFVAGGGGPGVVQVTERRVVYMGPVTGGAVALGEMTALSLRRDDDGTVHWVLQQPGELLDIPVDAEGAGALFDAFVTLDGLSAPHLLRVLDRTEPGQHRVWTRNASQDAALPRP